MEKSSTSMSLAEYVVPNAVLCDMDVADKEDALRQLVDALVAAKAFSKAKGATVINAIIARERKATTGIGNGVGIPHARSDVTKNIVMAIGKVRSGLDFGAVDGERVRVILLLVSPESRQEEHLRVMRRIVQIVRDPYQCKRLLGCSTPDSFMDLLSEIGS